jgi:hypothetical protein
LLSAKFLRQVKSPEQQIKTRIPSAIFFAAFHYDWFTVWNLVGVRSMAPPFRDLRVITSGVETFEHGGRSAFCRDRPKTVSHRRLGGRGNPAARPKAPGRYCVPGGSVYG